MGTRSGFPQLGHLDTKGSDVRRPAGMHLSFHQTGSLASMLLSRNCKQTEAAVSHSENVFPY